MKQAQNKPRYIQVDRQQCVLRPVDVEALIAEDHVVRTLWRFLGTLDQLGYSGPLTIEREIPQDPARQKEEIGRAVELLSGLKAKLTR